MACARGSAIDYIIIAGARAGFGLLLHKSSSAFLKATTSSVVVDADPFIIHAYILKMSANGTAINLDQRSYAFFSLLTLHSDAY